MKSLAIQSALAVLVIAIIAMFTWNVAIALGTIVLVLIIGVRLANRELGRRQK